MSPTAEQHDAFHTFELFVSIIAVTLRKPDIIAEEFIGNLSTMAATVIMKHYVFGDAVTQAPPITFSRLVFLVVYNRYHTLIYLYIFTQEYLLFKEIIEKLQLFHCRLIPSTHGRVTDDYAGFTVLLYKAVERLMIHELADDNVSQYGRSCHTFTDKHQRKRTDKDMPFFRMLFLEF